MSQDPYLDPRVGVLRNRLGLTDPDELDRAEADLTGYRLVELHERALPGAYDLAHLQAFRFIFGDLYGWAGELRTASIARTDLFCLRRTSSASPRTSSASSPAATTTCATWARRRSWPHWPICSATSTP